MKAARLNRDDRGAVLAEFAIAIVPILTAFFCFVQLAALGTAKLVMQHGAIVAARAAAVITNGHDNTPGQAKGVHEDQIRNAALLAMFTWTSTGKITDVSVEINDMSSEDDPYGMVEVRTRAVYHCDVPLGWVICGGRTRAMTETKQMAHQGANYKGSQID